MREVLCSKNLHLSLERATSSGRAELDGRLTFPMRPVFSIHPQEFPLEAGSILLKQECPTEAVSLFISEPSPRVVSCFALSFFVVFLSRCREADILSSLRTSPSCDGAASRASFCRQLIPPDVLLDSISRPWSYSSKFVDFTPRQPSLVSPPLRALPPWLSDPIHP